MICTSPVKIGARVGSFAPSGVIGVSTWMVPILRSVTISSVYRLAASMSALRLSRSAIVEKQSTKEVDRNTDARKALPIRLAAYMGMRSDNIKYCAKQNRSTVGCGLFV